MITLSRFSATLEKGEAALFFSRVSRYYLTGISSSDGILLVTCEGGSLYLDSRYYEMATLKQKEGLLPEGLAVFPYRFSQEMKVLTDSGRITRVLFEDRSLTVAELESLKSRFPKAQFSPMGHRLEEERVVKGPEEIGRIRASQALAEEAYRYILPRLSVGRSEREIAAELEYYMKKNGAEGPSFSTICVSGTRSSLPHGTPTDAVLEKGGFVTLDFGCMLDGYASDMTRTVCIGRASEEMKKVYGTVLKAQEDAIAAVRANVSGKTVDRAARSVIETAGYGEYFGHSTGHGLGLEVHEAPSFSPSFEGKIPAGAVLSVEPGIYLPGRFGVRIEDLVVVTEAGCENLNRTGKELLEL